MTTLIACAAIQTNPARAAAPDCLLEGEWASSLQTTKVKLGTPSAEPNCLEPGEWGAIEEAGLTPVSIVPLVEEAPAPAPEPKTALNLKTFLDRVMHAESGGKLDAKNPRSTALGPFQFINATFLSVVKRNFASEVAGKSNAQILALRTNMEFSRRAVEAFTRENAEYLEARGVAVTGPGLRLAHLLGPAGAVQALKAAPDTPLHKVFSGAVLSANPFMKRLTAAGLIRRAEREVGVDKPAETTTSQAQVDRISLRTESPEPTREARKESSHKVAKVATAKKKASRVAIAHHRAKQRTAKGRSVEKVATIGKRRRVAGS